MAQVTQIPACFVVVAIDSKFSDEYGPWDEAWIFCPETSQLLLVGGPHEDLPHGIRVNCTEEQKAAAAEVYASGPVKNINRVNGNPTFVGCVVTLKGSRKAPNRLPVQVVNHQPGGYNPQYNRMDSEKIQVKWIDDTGLVSKEWVSKGCVDEVVKGRYPWWV